MVVAPVGAPSSAPVCAIFAGIGSGIRRLRLLSLFVLPDLHTLDLGNNRLEGAIPTGLLLPSSPSLKVLILANNGGLSSHIPAQFSSSHGSVGAHVKDLLGPNFVSLACGSFGQQFQSSLRLTL
jgi:hypothetical protein